MGDRLSSLQAHNRNRHLLLFYLSLSLSQLIMALEQGRFPANGSLPEALLVHHKEKHFTAGEIVRDVIIGVSDGLTVPFALAAGLSGAAAPSSLILTAGLAEVAAGAISMGLGG